MSIISVISFSQPVVVTHPNDTSICIESTASFTILAINTSGYQWQENDGVGWYNLTNDFTYVDGQFTPNLSVNDANLGLNGYLYRCVVSDLTSAKDTSHAAILNVYEPPIITQNPVDDQVCKNDIAIFSIDALNGTIYQWQEFSGVGWISLEDNSFYSGSQTPDLGIFTTTGMNGFKYRCIVSHITCPDTSDFGILHVDATPIIHTITGGGEFCEDNNGVDIGLDGSDLGISYSLVLYGIPTGLVQEGNGNSLNFGIINIAGNYTATAYNQFTGCSIDMSSNAVVVMNPIPDDFPLQGGGSMCAGDEGENIFLLSSQLGVIYELYLNGQPIDVTITGTGFALSFGFHNQEGFYTVIATNLNTSCSIQMSGNAQIIVNDLPIVDAGEDNFISQGNTVELNGMAIGGSGNFNYEWKPSNLCVLPSNPVTQTNALYNSTIFTFEVHDNQTACSSIPDTTVVYVNTGPLSIQTYSDKNNICSGGNINLMAIPAGGSGSYGYLWSSSPPGYSSTEQNPTISPSISTIYFLEVFDGQETVYDSVSIFIKPLPSVFTIQGGGSYCQGEDGLEISLNGSELETTYYLYQDQNQLIDKFGNGQALSFGIISPIGTYTVTAVNNTTGCSTDQNGEVEIGINQLPIANAGPNEYIPSGSSANFNGTASGGTGSYNYAWSPIDSLLNPNIASPSSKPLHTTNVFYLKVTDELGCESLEDNVIAFISGGDINLEIITSEFPTCAGDDIELFALVSGGSGNFSYIWQSNPPGFTSSNFNPTVNPQFDTWYKVIANDGLQTIADSIYITVHPSPQAFDISGGGDYCEGNIIPEIILNSSEIETNYHLQFNGGQTQTTISGTGYPLNFGQQSLSGEYTIIANNYYSGCSNQMNTSVTITKNNSPIVNAGLDKTIISGNTTSLAGEVFGGSGSYNYNWQAAHLCLTPNNQNTITSNIYLPTIFTFQVTDLQSGCFSNPDSVKVFTTGSTLFAVATAESGTICDGGNAQLNASVGGGTGNYNYTWTSSPQGLYSNEANIIIQPQISSTYFLNVFDGINYAFDTLEMIVANNPIKYSLVGGGQYCVGDEGRNISLSNSQTATNYDLYLYPDNLTNSITGTGSSINFGNFQEEGDYFVIATSVEYCSNQMSNTVNIAQNIPPNANAGNDKTINYGDITVLNGSGIGGSGNYNYAWSPPDSVVNASSQDALTVNLHKTAQFQLEINDSQTNCIGNKNDNVVVFVSGGNLDLDLISSKSIVCPEEEFQLFALATGGTGNYIYTWLSEPQGFSSSTYNPILQQNQTAIYTAIVTDGLNSISKSIQIELNNVPIAFELIGGGEICEGELSEEIVLQSSEINTTYYLFHNNILTGIEKQGNGFALNFGFWVEEGSYYLIAENNQSTCSNQMAGNVNILLNETPVANAGNDNLIFMGSSAVLNGSASGGSGSYSYSWAPHLMVENPNNQNTQTNIIDQTTWFTLNIEDLQTQCTSKEDTVFVFVKGGDLSATVSSTSTSICESEKTSLLGIASGGTGNFLYNWSSSPEGFYSNNYNPQISPIVSTSYYLEVYDGVAYAYDSIHIEVSSKPQTFDIIGGGEFCEGQLGVNISLSGSEVNTDYILYQSPETEVNILSGTGNTLNYGLINNTGTYYVIANINQTCSKLMNSEVFVQQNPLPSAQAGQDLSITYGNNATLNGNATSGSGSYLFNWSPADSLLNSTSQNPVTQPLHSTTVFNLSVTDANTLCINSDEDEVVVFVSGGTFTSYTTVDNALICPDEEVQLNCLVSGGSGNYSYLWESIPSGFTSTRYNPTTTPVNSTIFYVSISDGSSIITDSIVVNVNPAPIAFNLLGGGEYCANEDGIELSLSNSESSVNYSLFNTNGYTGLSVAGNNGPLNFEQQTESSEYFVIGENALSLCNTQMNNFATIVMNDLPVAIAGSDQSIESGEITQLIGNGSGGSAVYHYNWSPDYLLENANEQNPYTLALTSSTNFLLNITDNQTNCISVSDSCVVFIIGGPLGINATASEISICKGSSSQLNALASGGSGNYSYSWTSYPQGFESAISNPVISPETTTWYFIELIDGNQSISDSIRITVNSTPTLFQLDGGGEFCMGDDGMSINLSGSESQVVYQLYRDGNNLVNEKIGNGSNISFGEYTTSGTYTSKAYSIESVCNKNMIGSAVVIKNPKPEADAGPDKFTSPGGNATLNGNATNGSGSYLYNWNPTIHLINPSDQNPTTIALNQSTQFKLKVTDQLTGCISSESGAIVFISGGLPLTNEILSPTQSVCPGEQLSIISIPTGGNGSYSYYWTSNPSGFISTASEINVNPVVNTWYIVRVSDGIETTKDSIAININTVPESYNLLGGGGYCPDEQGVNVYLENSENGVTYSLFHNVQSTGINLAGTGSSINFGKMITEGNYSIIATGQNQCTSLMSNSVQVNQNSKPQKFQLIGGGIYCDNDPGLGILLESSEKDVNYELYRNAINTGINRLGNGLPLSFTNLNENGIFTVTATNTTSNCFENMNGAIPMLIHESPNLNINGADEICYGDTTTLTASGGLNYVWNTIPQQETASIIVSPEFNTVYSVVSNNNYCSDVDSVLVNVFDKPSISLENDLLSYTIICTPYDLQTYEFYHGNELVQSGGSNTLFYGDLSLDSDTMTVVGTNISDCSDITSIFLELEDAPNAFTPDGDGVNDRFMEGRDIRVYSRWGKDIFNGSDGWDGTYNGKIVTPATYYYIHYIYNTDGDIIKTNKGSVTVVVN